MTHSDSARSAAAAPKASAAQPSQSMPDTAGEALPLVVPKKAAKPQFTSMMLVLEAIVVFFATLTASKLVDAPIMQIWLAGGTLSLVLLVLSRLVTAPAGYVAGSVVQVPVLAIGLVVPLMVPVAGVFIGLWVASLWLGTKIDRERAEYDAAHPGEVPPL